MQPKQRGEEEEDKAGPVRPAVIASLLQSKAPSVSLDCQKPGQQEKTARVTEHRERERHITATQPNRCTPTQRDRADRTKT